MSGNKFDLSDVIAGLLVAGGPWTFAVSTPFPLHEAVRNLFHDAGSGCPSDELVLSPEPDIGLAVNGIPDGIYRLLLTDVLYVGFWDNATYYRTDADQLKNARRQLMRLDPVEAGAYRRAATAWSARCSSLSKRSRSFPNAEGSSPVERKKRLTNRLMRSKSCN